MSSQDSRVIQHAENVWSYRHNWERVEPAVGMILTDEGWIVVDGGSCPVHGRQVLAAMQQISDVPTRYVIATHRHWDHTFGNQVFDAPVISSQKCKDRMLMNMQDDWSADRVIDWLVSDMFPHIPGLSEADFEGLELIVPSETFETDMSLKIGNVELELFLLNNVHADDNIGVYLPEQRVIFLGDAFYYPAPEGRVTNLPVLVEKVAELDLETLIPGHERPHNREVFEQFREYVLTLQDRIQEIVNAGQPEEAALQIPFEERFQRTSFLNEKQHRKTIKLAFRELSA
jgi:glyoxylase-like metal-dependent hydrolase (beta-lactamase superfamily II)